MAPAATPETRIARAAAPLIAAGHPTGLARSGMLLGVLALAAPERAAVRAGCRAARRGGTAVDAALAAAAALAVTLPNQCGLGGDLLAVVRRPDGSMVAVDGAGTAARRVDVEAQRRRGAAMPDDGPDTVTVPGAVAGWAVLHGLGAALPWPAIFADAIALAEDGTAVAPDLGAAIARERARLQADPGLRPWIALRAGEVLRQPALAATLRAIAADGPGALYVGAVGADLVAALAARVGAAPRRPGRLHGARAAGAERERRRRADRHLPPAVRGRRAPPGAGRARPRRRARRRLADPAVAGDGADWLDDARVDPVLRPSTRPAPAAWPTAAGDTVAVVAADGEGWAVSLVQSLFEAFGAGIRDPQTGIVVHNRGTSFSLEASHPNVLAPGKRPAHTLTPLVVGRGGALAAVRGTMGGARQPAILLQVLSRLLAGATPQQAVAAPRWVVDAASGGVPGVLVEPGLEPVALAALRASGLPVRAPGDWSQAAGHAQAIAVGPDGALQAGSDPRADGTACVIDQRGGGP